VILSPLEIRERHHAKYFGELTESVIHSVDLKVPHVDIYQFRPIDERRGNGEVVACLGGLNG
jgi:hypothetical protein